MADRRDEEERVRQLIALATGSPFSEEGRTAALAAVRLIEKHGLLSRGDRTHQELALAPTVDDSAQSLEIERLKKQIAKLKATRRERQSTPVAPGSALLVLDSLSKVREIETLRAEVRRLQTLPPVTVLVHVVRPGESPIIITETYTGDPSRVVELVGANLSKPRVLTSHGWTFRELFVGERLRLPIGWA